MKKLVALLGCVFVLNACFEPGNPPPYEVPLFTNGITYQDNLVWVTDFLGQTITAFDPETGFMKNQFDFSTSNTGPDDLVFLEDGTIVWTAPITGRVGTTDTVNDVVNILATPGESVNPIAKNSAGEVFIGYKNETGSVIGKVNVETGEVTEVVTNLPSLNAFAFGPDGFLYAPKFDFSAILSGEGGIIKIDIDNNSFEALEFTFPDQPNKTGFQNTTAVKFDANGNMLVLESTQPKLYRVDLTNNIASLIGGIPVPATDNIAIDDLENIYVTTFTSNTVFVFDANGNKRKITIRNE